MAQDQEEALGNGPQLEAVRQVAGQRPGPLVGRIAVQIDVQLRARQSQCLIPRRALVQRRLLAVLDVVAQRAVAGGVQHVVWIAGGQLALQGIAVGIFQRHQGKVRVGLLREGPGRAQCAHHARGFVGMLAAADEDRGTGAALVDPAHGAALPARRAKAVAAQQRHLAGDPAGSGRSLELFQRRGIGRRVGVAGGFRAAVRIRKRRCATGAQCRSLARRERSVPVAAAGRPPPGPTGAGKSRAGRSRCPRAALRGC